MGRFKTIPKSIADLKAIAFPHGADVESIPYSIYDTQIYPAGGIGGLTFFQQTSPDSTLTNVEAAGQLPEPQWFELQYIYVDFMRGGVTNEDDSAAATRQVGIATDIETILKNARGIAQLIVAQKLYGWRPLTMLQASGGAVGAIAVGIGEDAAASGRAQQLAQNGLIGNGLYYGGSVVIPPKQNFKLNMQFQPTLVPISADLPVRVTLDGVLHRAVR